jgi:Uma2 family endonuclease
MERKLRLYRRAAVREYWVLNPEKKAVTAYRFAESAVLPPGDLYNAKDTAPVTVLSGLGIDLESIFAE